MPRIPQDNLNRGISEDVRVAVPTQDDSLAKAVGNLGRTGEQLFAKLKDQQDTSDFLDWRHQYDNTFRESRANFIQDLSQAGLDGKYSYERLDADGNPSQRAGDVFTDRMSMELAHSQLSAQGDSLVKSQEAKRHYTSKENQIGAKLSLDITSHMNKKRRAMVDTQLSRDLNNQILDIGSGITPSQQDVDDVLKRLDGTSMESSVLGTEAIEDKRQRYLASMGQAIVSGMADYGDNPALQAVLKKLGPSFDKETKARLDIGVQDAKAKYSIKVATKAETKFNAVKKLENMEDYVNTRDGLIPTAREYANTGSMDSGKANEVLDMLAKASHFDERLGVGVTMGLIDSKGKAEKLFEQMKDTPLVQAMGENKFKDELFRRVASVDRGAASMLESFPDQFALMYDKGIADKITKNADVVGGTDDLHALYERGNISRSRRNYAIKPLVDLEKPFWKDPRVAKGIIDHVESWEALSSNVRDRTINQLAVAGAVPKYAVAMHKLPPGSQLSSSIAEAAIGYGDNRVHAAFAVDGDNKNTGISVKQVDTLVDSALAESFVVPSSGRTEDKVFSRGVQEAAKMMIFNRATQGRGDRAISANDVGTITNDVIKEFQDQFTSVAGDKGALMFDRKSLPVSGNTVVNYEHQIKGIADNPVEILEFIDMPLNYEKIRESLVKGALQGSSESVDTLDQVIAEKDPERKKAIFKEFFGDKLTLGRNSQFNDKISVMFGPSDLPMPLLLKDPKDPEANIPLTMEDSGFFQLVKDKSRADLTKELASIKENVGKFSPETYRSRVMKKRIEELENVLR